MRAWLACGVVMVGSGLAPFARAEATKSDSPAFDTPAQAAVKKLPKEVVNAPVPRRFATRNARNEEISAAVQMEEIRVYGQVDPEDYARHNTPTAMQQFRSRLENDRPMTPKEIAQLFCLLGPCVYGPDGLPPEPNIDARNAARTNMSTVQLSTQFKGTLQ